MSLYFQEYGDKTASTIVFIHGGGVSGWMWEKQLEYFKDFHCIVPDLPEHGKSLHEGNISIHDSALSIAEIIEKHANGGKADVVGHSLGAKITVELLSIRPEIIKHAVVASALFRPIPLIKMSHRHFVYRITAFLLKNKWFSTLEVKQFNFPNKAYQDNCFREFQGMNADSLYRIYDELYLHLSLPEGLENINVPVLAVAGEKELKAMRDSVSDIVNAIPDSQGVFINNGLHTYPWAMHEQFNKFIDEWINKKKG